MSTDDSLNQKTTIFFATLGQAITIWAHVDRLLFDLCDYALRSQSEKTAVIFYRIKTIGEHLALTDNLLELSLSEENQKKWSVISSMIVTLLSFRNDLAHNPALQVADLPIKEGWVTLDIPVNEQWWEIRTEQRKLLHKKHKQKRASVEEIKLHVLSVQRLVNSINEFRKTLPKKPPKTPLQSAVSGVLRALSRFQNDDPSRPKQRRP
jgi:hypothetical protein